MPTVLYVEDAVELQRLYSIGLKHEGFDVSVAGTGGEALVELEGRNFDILLLDMMSGGMSGLDVLTQSGVHFRSPQTLIIALSNIDNPDIVRRAKDSGVSHYLVKSEYDPHTLAALI